MASCSKRFREVSGVFRKWGLCLKSLGPSECSRASRHVYIYVYIYIYIYMYGYVHVEVLMMSILTSLRESLTPNLRELRTNTSQFATGGSFCWNGWKLRQPGPDFGMGGSIEGDTLEAYEMRFVCVFGKFGASGGTGVQAVFWHESAFLGFFGSGI